MRAVDGKTGLLLVLAMALVWPLLALMRARKNRVSSPKGEPWKLLKAVPGDWKDAVYSPRALRKPKK